MGLKREFHIVQYFSQSVLDMPSLTGDINRIIGILDQFVEIKFTFTLNHVKHVSRELKN